MNTKLNSTEVYDQLLAIWKTVGFGDMNIKTAEGENQYIYDKKCKLWYTNISGVYFPNILRNPEDLYGRYGAMRLEFLENNFPKLVEEKEKTNELAKYLMEFNVKANEYFTSQQRQKITDDNINIEKFGGNFSNYFMALRNVYASANKNVIQDMIEKI